ncbi:MAG: insulinase family protein [Myxococcaceae bacterium]|nr:MAG: insulinase family protein [Myxococcaceae bacterium]
MPSRHRLDNGLTVLHEHQGAAHVVAWQIWVNVGGADEGPDEAGLAHLHEHMLFKGTERRGPGEIARDIEAHGGEVNAWTSFDHTVYHTVMASQFAREGLDVLADAVRFPRFDPTELARECEVVVEEIKRADDAPARRASRDLFQVSYQVHPYRLPVLGTPESVRATTRERIFDFYRRHYTPEAMTLIAVGDVPLASVRAWAEELLGGDWGRPRAPGRDRGQEPGRTGRRIHLVPDEAKEAWLNVSFAIPAANHEDVPALDVLAMLAGSGETSRLFRQVKRDARLVNEISAYSYTPVDPGLFGLGMTLPGEKVRPALTESLRTLAQLATAPPTEEELATIKALVESEAVYARETVQGLARKLGHYETTLGGYEAEEKYHARVAALTPDAVWQVARRYVDFDTAVVTGLLPAGAQLTEVEVHAALDEARREPGVTTPARRAQTVPAAAMPKLKGTGPEAGTITLETLPNGARLILREERATPLVAMRAAFIGGLRFETEQTNGLTTLLSRMLTRGTSSLGAEEIQHVMDACAGSMSGAGGRNSVSLRAEGLSRHFDRAFTLFADCLLDPAFPEDELERERSLLLQEIAAREDRPSSLAFDTFSRTLFQHHPYRMPQIGERATVELLGAEQLRAHHRRFLDPSRMVLAIIGDVNGSHVLERARALFGPAGEGPQQVPDVPREAPPTERLRVHRTLARAQAHVVLGFQGLTLFDPDRHALEVLSTVLSGMGGRLFTELRDKRSMAYTVTSMAVEGLDPGYFAVYIGTSPDKREAAEAGMEAELRRVLDEPVSPAELERAKAHLVGTHEIGLQRNAARAALLALDGVYGLGLDNFEHYDERIQAVTAEDVLRVARRVIQLEQAVVAVVGP